jgi:hypothetical protein
MKKIILIISLPIIVILYLVLSVYYPNYFIIGGNVNDIKFELKNFSIFNPSYIGSRYDELDGRYNVYFTTLTRNKFLFWDSDPEKYTKAIVTKSDFNDFKKELKTELKSSTEDILNNSKVIFKDKYEVKPNDTYEEKQLKFSWLPPKRENSIHYNLDKFKLLKPGMNCVEFSPIIDSADFSLGYDDFYPNFARIVYNIGSSKVSFVFLTFKEKAPCYSEEDSLNVKLVDIVIITHRQEMIKVPVNPDGTYNWEAVKDKID